MPALENNPSEKQGFIASHSYTIASVIAIMLIAVGAFFVTRAIHSPAQSSSFSWQTSQSLPSNPVYNGGTEVTTSTSTSPIEQGGEDVTIPQPAQTNESITSQENASASLDALLAQLSAESSTKTSSAAPATSSDSAISEAYSYIPTGLIAASTSMEAETKRTPLQEKLYLYGNNAGSVIQTFEFTHTNMAQVLKDQADDRNDPDKAARLKELGTALSGVGRSLLVLDNVPASIALYNTALGKSYEDIGAKLALVADAGTDKQFLAAVETYDAAVDTFTKNYVALAEYLAASHVTFSSSDSGSVFSFTAASL